MRKAKSCLRKTGQAFLQCEVFDGMFSNEYTIQAIDRDGNIISGFFIKEIVDKEKQQMAVEITHEDSNSYLVSVPGQNCGCMGWINAGRVWGPKTAVVLK